MKAFHTKIPLQDKPITVSEQRRMSKQQCDTEAETKSLHRSKSFDEENGR